MKLSPVGARLWVFAWVVDASPLGLIIIPEKHQRRAICGEIKAVGSGVTNPLLRVGRAVMFGKLGTKLLPDSILGKGHLIIKENQVVGTLAQYDDNDKVWLQSPLGGVMLGHISKKKGEKDLPGLARVRGIGYVDVMDLYDTKHEAEQGARRVTL